MVSLPFIEVRHNMEVAHRLFKTSGKCEQIHGHSMWVDLRLYGTDLENGIMLNCKGTPLEFGTVKQLFRSFLNGYYDHHLLLNENDPWAGWLSSDGSPGKEDHRLELSKLPGLTTTPDDPTTENIAHWIAEWAAGIYQTDVDVLVRETSVNAAAAGAIWKPGPAEG